MKCVLQLIYQLLFCRSFFSPFTLSMTFCPLNCTQPRFQDPPCIAVYNADPFIRENAIRVLRHCQKQRRLQPSSQRCHEFDGNSIDVFFNSNGFTSGFSACPKFSFTMLLQTYKQSTTHRFHSTCHHPQQHSLVYGYIISINQNSSDTEPKMPRQLPGDAQNIHRRMDDTEFYASCSIFP